MGEELKNIKDRLRDVLSSIKSSLKKVSRKSSDCCLVAVSKTHPTSVIKEALECGHRVFGENRVQEAQDKWPDLKSQYENVELHLIGSLQTNKAGDAVGLFDVIETLDRPKLARALKAAMDKSHKEVKLFIQVNTGGEGQKGGIAPKELEGFLSYCQNDLELSIEGLMCIPPVDEEPSVHFALLHKFAKRHGLHSLSMGMSGDYEVACQFGATHVRVGTGVFGKRPPFKP